MPETDDSIEAGRTDWRTLTETVADVLRPGSSGYEDVRKLAGRRFDHIRPQAVVRCRSEQDVAEALRFARARNIPVAVRSGGHDFAGRSTGSGMVVDLTPMNRVAIEGTRVAVGAGARLADVYRALDSDRRTIPAGCGPTVGVAGLTLGGGLGVLGRMYGLTCDHLLAARAVLADGSTVWCDPQQHADLFWALRGGGAMGVGVVAELVFNTVPAPRCTVFRLAWRWQDAAEVIDAWQIWAPNTVDAVAASLLIAVPPDPSQPPTVTIFGSAAQTTAGETGMLLRELSTRVGAPPQQHWQREAPWRDTKTLLATLAPGDNDGHLYSRSEFFRKPIPPAAVRDLTDQLASDRRPGEARELDFSPWGGAYNRTPTAATAFPHRQEQFLVKHTATVKPSLADPQPAPSAWLDASWQTVHPHGTGGVYPNFPDPGLPDPERAYYRDNLDRLRRVKTAYDPSGLLPPAGHHADTDTRP